MLLVKFWKIIYVLIVVESKFTGEIKVKKRRKQRELLEKVSKEPP